MRVLVVEDEPDIAFLYRLYLSDEGHECHIYNGNYSEFFIADILDECDAAIVDLMLPGVSGKEIVSFIKGYNPNIRVVVVTAALNLIDEALLAHADMVLSKPFRPLDLVVAIEGKDMTEGNGATVLRRTMHRYIWEGQKKHGGSSGA